MSADSFSKLVFDLSEQLTRENIEALKYMYKLLDENMSHLGVLKTLERKGVFSSSNSKGLKNLLSNIHRCDLMDLVKSVESNKVSVQLCYYQAKSIEEQLAVIKADLLEFCKKQECSPTERLFCKKISFKVEKVQKEARDYLINPLRQIYSSADSERPQDVIGSNFRPVRAAGTTNRSKPATDSKQSKQESNEHIQIPKTHQITIPQKHNTISYPIGGGSSDADYDFLSPLSCSEVSKEVQYYACTDLMRVRRDIQSTAESTAKQQQQQQQKQPYLLPLNTRRGDVVCSGAQEKSVPNTSPRLNQKKLIHRSNSADDLLSPHQGSNIPVLKKRLKSNSSQITRSKNNPDIETTTGSSDSGFCDPSEFLQYPVSQGSISKQHHHYASPNNSTKDEPNVYSRLMKRDS